MPDPANILTGLCRPAISGGLGGARLDPTRAASSWGGNFHALPDETPPRTPDGQPMHPLLQIRTDELPQALPALHDIALLSLWVAPDADLWDAVENTDFAVRTYPDIETLTPLPAAGPYPALPLFWAETGPEPPTWDDILDHLPDTIAAGSADWFFDSSQVETANRLQAAYPIKLGGWPQWIQGAQYPADAQFCLQIDANDKGGLKLGDDGSLYLFRSRTGWLLLADCS